MAAAIGMSVPGSTDLGLGSTLTQQVAGETEDERKRRMLQQRQQQLLPGTSAGTSSLMTGYSAVVPTL